jgi:hypothetical protein
MVAPPLPHFCALLILHVASHFLAASRAVPTIAHLLDTPTLLAAAPP